MSEPATPEQRREALETILRYMSDPEIAKRVEDLLCGGSLRKWLRLDEVPHPYSDHFVWPMQHIWKVSPKDGFQVCSRCGIYRRLDGKSDEGACSSQS